MEKLNEALNIINDYISEPDNFIYLIETNNLEDVSKSRAYLEDVIRRIGDDAFYEIVNRIDETEYGDDRDGDVDENGNEFHSEPCMLHIDSWDHEDLEHYAIWFAALNLDKDGRPHINIK